MEAITDPRCAALLSSDEPSTVASDAPLATIRSEGHEGRALDAAEVARLYDAEYRHLVRMASVLVDTVADAEEVVQDALARLLASRRSIDNPAAYLRRSVLNGCRDVHRRRAVRRAHEPAPVPPIEPPEPADDDLLAAVRSLRPKARAVVVLRFYEDLSIHQIAEATGLRPGTVKSTLHRALQQLREVVEP